MALRFFLVLGFALLLAARGATLADEAARPNILWVSCEDTGPEMGCYGDAYAVTPNIDRLASQGVRFTNAFSHSGVCAPTRSGIITGMYPTTIGTHGMRSNGVPPAYVKCFTEYLRAAGYYCTNDNKTDYNFAAPVTAWDDNRRGAHWRNRPRKDQPFFAVVNITSSHESQIRQPEAQYRKLIATFEPEEIHDPEKATLPPYYPDAPVVRKDWARYYDIVTGMDKTVGQVLQDLEDDGLADKTIVFFWGDHGRGLPRGKRWLYDSGIHVPLIVRWPGVIEPGTTNDEMVCFLDLAPTVLSLAGVEIPKHLQGQVILGPHKAPPRQYIFAARDRMDETRDTIRAVRDERYKYLRNFMPEQPYAAPIAYMDEMPSMREWRRLNAAGKLTGPQTLFFRKTKPVEELFDTQADPHEVKDLADQPEMQETLQRMRAELDRWMHDTGDLGLIPEPVLEEQRRPGGQWSVTADPVIKREDGKATITCATEGASLAYIIGPPKKGREHWLLYTEPVAVPPGEVIRARACRLGYHDSAVVKGNAE